jgi:signal transduction histidine kinase
LTTCEWRRLGFTRAGRRHLACATPDADAGDRRRIFGDTDWVTLRLQLILFQLLLFLAVLAMAGVVWIATSTMVQRLARVHLSHEQVEAALELDGSFNRLSEQLAELLLLGAAGRDQQRTDLDAARARVRADLARLERIGNDELAVLDDAAEREAEAIEAVRVERLHRLYAELEAVTDEILRIDASGNTAAAVRLYGARVEQLLDDELDRLIDDSVADEQEEYAQVSNATRRLARRLTVGTLVALVLIGTAAILLGVFFYRSIGPPLRRLGAAAEAVEAGDLAHRIEVGRVDEVGLLSQRFNRMVGELQRQREALLAAQVRLESQVAERTRELRESNRRLVLLDQQRLRFLAEASHQLRTPLTVLRGEAEVTLRNQGAAAAELRESLQLVAEQASDMGRLVADLLALTRSDSQEAELQLESIPLIELADELVRDARLLGEGRPVELQVAAAAEELSLHTDAGRLRQALMILLDNALKYSGGQEPVCLKVARAGDTVEIRIEDRGVGIAAEDLPFVFEPFYRGRSVRHAGIAGSGLGLPIARRIVARLGGTLELDSGEGEGTVARVRLPLESPT